MLTGTTAQSSALSDFNKNPFFPKEPSLPFMYFIALYF